MAMSRSFGRTSFTTRSPMRISPALAVSSPAIRLSRVDLPQPEGPTSTRNSPEATDRETPFSTSSAPKDLRIRDRQRVIIALILSPRPP
jgi:hypothetical protein